MSSSFRPKGVSGPRAFRPQNAQPRREYPRDRRAVVEGYDLANGVMLATEIKSGEALQVKIQQRQVTTAAAASAATKPTSNNAPKWRGNSINQLMVEGVPPGSWVLLEGCRGNQKINQGGKSILPVEARWVTNVPDPRPEKCFDGVFTINAFRGDLQRVQSWEPAPEPKAIDVSDADSIAAFGEKLDVAFTAHQNKEPGQRFGYQLRVVKQTAEATEKSAAKYTVIDMSVPIDWWKDEGAAPDDFGRPVNRSDLNEHVNLYIEHIYGSDPADTSIAAEDRQEPKFDAATLDKCRIEISTYQSYKAGSVEFNKGLKLREPQPGQFGDNLYRLANTPTKCSYDDDYSVGKNYCVQGILMLTADGVDLKDRANPKSVPQNLVRQLFANGPIGHVQSYVLTADGVRPSVDPLLDRLKVEPAAANKTAAAGNTGSSELTTPQSDVLSGIDAPFGEDPFLGSEGGAEDPFATGAAPAEAEAAPAPAEAATPAAAPASRPGGRPGRPQV